MEIHFLFVCQPNTTPELMLFLCQPCLLFSGLWLALKRKSCVVCACKYSHIPFLSAVLLSPDWDIWIFTWKANAWQSLLMLECQQGEAKAIETSNAQRKFQQATRNCTPHSGLLTTRFFASRRQQMKKEVGVRLRICLSPFSRHHLLVVSAMAKPKLKRY